MPREEISTASVSGLKSSAQRNLSSAAGNPFDSLIIGCYESGKLNFVSKIRNGFVPHFVPAAAGATHQQMSVCKSTGETSRTVAGDGKLPVA